MSKSTTKTIDIVIEIFNSWKSIFTSKELEKITWASKSSISYVIWKLIESNRVHSLNWTRWVFIKEHNFVDKKDLYLIWNKIFKDSILTWNESLKSQLVKKDKWAYEFLFSTFIWRNRKILDKDLYLSIEFFKDKIKYFSEFENEILENWTILMYSIEKSLLDQIDFDLNNKNKRNYDEEVDYSKINREKIFYLSSFYKDNVKKQLEYEFDIFDKNYSINIK